MCLCLWKKNQPNARNRTIQLYTFTHTAYSYLFYKKSPKKKAGFSISISRAKGKLLCRHAVPS